MAEHTLKILRCSHSLKYGHFSTLLMKGLVACIILHPPPVKHVFPGALKTHQFNSLSLETKHFLNRALYKVRPVVRPSLEHTNPF